MTFREVALLVRKLKKDVHELKSSNAPQEEVKTIATWVGTIANSEMTILDYS